MAQQKEKTPFQKWEEEVLAPALKPILNTIPAFEDLHLTRAGGEGAKTGWKAQCHLVVETDAEGKNIFTPGKERQVVDFNGSYFHDFSDRFAFTWEGSDLNKDGTPRRALSIVQYYVYLTCPQCRTGKDIDAFYQKAQELATIAGVTPPPHIGGSVSADFADIPQEVLDRKEWVEACAEAWDIFKKALQEANDNARPIMYMNKRNWSREALVKAGIGILTPQVYAELPLLIRDNLSPYRANTHEIVIPYLIDEKATAFTLRRTDGKIEGKVLTENGVEAIIGYKDLNGNLHCEHPRMGEVKEWKEPLKYYNIAFNKKGQIETGEKNQMRNEGFCGMNRNMPFFIVVEGYLDYYNAKIHGIPNVVCAGGAPTKEQVHAALRREPEKIIIATDHDARGYDFAKNTVSFVRAYCQEKGKDIPVYVTFTPEGYKDLDEFLSEGKTKEDFENQVLAKVTSGEAYCTLFELSKKINGTTEKGEPCVWYDPTDEMEVEYTIARVKKMNTEQRDELIKAVRDIAMQAQIFHRGEVFKTYAPLSEELGVTVEEIRASVKAQTESQEKAERDEAFKLILTAHKNGDVKAVIDAAKKYAEAGVRSKDARHYEITPHYATKEDVRAERAKKKMGLPTGFGVRSQKGNTVYPIELMPGHTLICASTSHGKTSILNNIVLYIAKRNLAMYKAGYDKKLKKILYFSYEIDRPTLLCDFLCLYNNDPNIAKKDEEAGAEASKAIYAFSHGDESLINTEGTIEGKTHLQHLKEKQDELDEEFFKSGAITIIDEELSLEELLPHTEWEMARSEFNLVAVDYVQLITTEQNKQHLDNLRTITHGIKFFARKNQIPFLSACQFNRMVISPNSVAIENIGDSAEFGKDADTVWGFYLMDKVKQLTGNNTSQEMQATYNLFRDAGYILPFKYETIGGTATGHVKGKTSMILQPIPGLMFSILVKRRGGQTGVAEMLNFDGEIRKVTPNYSIQGMDPKLFEALEKIYYHPEECRKDITAIKGCNKEQAFEAMQENAKQQWLLLKEANVIARRVAVRGGCEKEHDEWINAKMAVNEFFKDDKTGEITLCLNAASEENTPTAPTAQSNYQNIYNNIPTHDEGENNQWSGMYNGQEKPETPFNDEAPNGETNGEGDEYYRQYREANELFKKITPHGETSNGETSNGETNSDEQEEEQEPPF